MWYWGSSAQRQLDSTTIIAENNEIQTKGLMMDVSGNNKQTNTRSNIHGLNAYLVQKWLWLSNTCEVSSMKCCLTWWQLLLTVCTVDTHRRARQGYLTLVPSHITLTQLYVHWHSLTQVSHIHMITTKELKCELYKTTLRTYRTPICTVPHYADINKL